MDNEGLNCTIYMLFNTQFTSRVLKLSPEIRINSHQIQTICDNQYIGVFKRRNGQVSTGFLSVTTQQETQIGKMVNGLNIYATRITENQYYTGYFKNNEPDGFGSLIQEQFCYRGELKANKKHGYGIYLQKNPKIKYKGFFNQDHLHGIGVWVEHRKQQCGNFINNQLDGPASQLFMFQYSTNYQIGLYRQNLYVGEGFLQRRILFNESCILIDIKGGSQTRGSVPVSIRYICTWLSKLPEQAQITTLHHQIILYCGEHYSNPIVQATELIDHQTLEIDNSQALMMAWNQTKEQFRQLSPQTILHSGYKQDDLSSYIYCGEFQKQLPSGIGIAIYYNDCIYEGFFKSGKEHGFGVLYQNDGSICSLFWDKGLPTNYAIIQYPNQGQYRGQIQEKFKPHGKGIMYNRNETMQGIWVQGRIYNGLIEYKCKCHNQRYKLCIEKGTIKKGNINTEDGFKYTGQLSVSPKGVIRQGFGTEYMNGESIFKGLYSNGLPNGYGYVETFDCKFEGYFKDGKCLKILKSSSYVDGVVTKYLHFDDVQYMISLNVHTNYQYVGGLLTNDRESYGTSILYKQHDQDDLKIKKIQFYLEKITQILKLLQYKAPNLKNIQESQGKSEIQTILHCGLWDGQKKFNGVISVNNIVLLEAEIYLSGWNKYKAQNGYTYQGNWVDGQLVVGSHSEPDKMRFYKGQYRFYQPNGQGILIWYVKGETYRKLLLKLLKYGKQENNFGLRDILDSNYSLDCENQQIYKYKYKGGFLNGKLCGIGIFSTHQILYRGGFINNCLHGKGHLIYEDQIYIQAWQQGILKKQKFNDQFSISYQSGEPYYIEQ